MHDFLHPTSPPVTRPTSTQPSTDPHLSTLSDPWADLSAPLPACPTCLHPLTGALTALIHLRTSHNPHLRLLLSIGGWSFSPAFALAASTPARRAAFAHSALSLVQTYGLDGVDIDWEYPSSPAEGDALVELMRTVRGVFDAAYASSISTSTTASGSATAARSKPYLLTLAAPSSAWTARFVPKAALDPYIDFWNVMAYDFSGPWAPVAGHASNLHPGTENGAGSGWSVEQAVALYRDAGVAGEKIVVGCPLYGRQFVGTEGVGKKFGCVGEKGSWEGGCWDLTALPLPVSEGEERAGQEGEAPATTTHTDTALGASWQYIAGRDGGTLITYDDVAVARMKARWVLEQGLGGVMWWESSGDRKLGEGSIVEAVTAVLSAR